MNRSVIVPTIDVVLFIQQAHAGVYRQDKITPYFEHPLNVLRIVRQELGLDSPLVDQATLLHDVEEDCSEQGFDLAFLEHMFGNPARLAHWCCKPPRPKGVDKLKYNFEHYRKLGLEGPKEAKSIKIADRLDNTKDFADWSPKFREYYIADTANLLTALDLSIVRPVGYDLLVQRYEKMKH